MRAVFARVLAAVAAVAVLAAGVVASAASTAHAAAAPVAMVVCAPGYPGTTVEAQKAMDALAAAVRAAAGSPEGSLTAVYFPREAEGLARFGDKDAAVALVPLPFYLAHREALGLKARLSVETATVGLVEQWTLVAQKGRVKSAADLASMTLTSTAGYAPRFVRGALAAWGRVPDETKIVDSAQVLSALRKAAKGPADAVLVDGAQAASLATLPFAADLEQVAKSPSVPTAVVATVGDRLDAGAWSSLEKALLAVSKEAAGVEALRTIRMVRFAPLEKDALGAAEAAWAGAAK